MKKRIFTLFALAMLIGGISSTLSAQVSVTGISLGTGTEVYERKVKANTIPPYVTNSDLSVTTMAVTLAGFPTTESSATVYFAYDETSQYLGLPASYTFYNLDTITSVTSRTFMVTVESNWNMPNSVSGSDGIVRASLDPTFITNVISSGTIKYYNYPTFEVEYFQTTSQFIGSLKILSIKGSNPDDYNNWYRILQKDEDYAYIKTEKVFDKFTDVEVANLVYGDKILVMGPMEHYFVDIPGIRNNDEIPHGTIPRAVTVPVVSGATLNIEPGVHHVPSTYDFSFTIKPTGSNEDLVPVVTTGRTNFPDSEGVTYQKLSDGSWLVTIIRLQSNINLSINFEVSNASIESNSVWANGGQLYVSSPTSGSANIYSITGALVKTVAFAAGETASISLSTGFYVVTVNGKAYKVTVK